MPNGVRRQRNTRHANRQRNVQIASEVQAEPVEDTPIVQAEAVEGRLYTAAEVEAMIERAAEESDLLDRYQKLKSKYNQAKSGNLLSFQEVEIEDLEQENFELKAELGLAAEKIDSLLRKSEDKIIANGNKGVEQFVQRTFIKTWQTEEPATFTIDGHQFTVIPHNYEDYWAERTSATAGSVNTYNRHKMIENVK